MNITKNLIDCIFFVCLGFSCIAVGIYLALKNKKSYVWRLISVACLSVLLSFYMDMNIMLNNKICIAQIAIMYIKHR